MKVHRIVGYALFLAVMVASAPSRAESADAVARAQSFHDQGVEMFRQERYREALEAFTESDRLVSDPNNLWNIMRCHQELGEYDEALRVLNQYIITPNLSPEDLQGAEEIRSQLQEARREAEQEQIPTVIRDLEPPPPSPPPPPPLSPQTSPPPPPIPEEPSLTGPWSLLGSGLGMVLLGGVLYVVAFVQADPNAYDQFDDFEEYDRWRTRIFSLAVAGDVLMGVGGAVAVGGLIWLLVARSRRSSEQATRHLSLAVSPDGVVLRTEFRF